MRIFSGTGAAAASAAGTGVGLGAGAGAFPAAAARGAAIPPFRPGAFAAAALVDPALFDPSIC
ncbi:MAG TPA: hypothetical protein VLM42_12045 [Bryobacteraceae bacterium]|nr:hypothetical protein [Bryobacteraceae bacterium]